MGWKSVAAAAPICGQSHRAEIAIRDLVRPMIVMSSRTYRRGWMGGAGSEN